MSDNNMTAAELRQLINEIDFGKDTLKQVFRRPASASSSPGVGQFNPIGLPSIPGLKEIAPGVMVLDIAEAIASISSETERCIFCNESIDDDEAHSHAMVELTNADDELIQRISFCVHTPCYKHAISTGTDKMIVNAAAMRKYKQDKLDNAQ